MKLHSMSVQIAIYIFFLSITSSCAYLSNSSEKRTPANLNSRDYNTEDLNEFVPYKNEVFGNYRKKLYQIYSKYADYFGYYNKERVQVHDEIIKAFLKKVTAKSVETPNIIWTMGSYGSGKSHVLEQLGEAGGLALENYVVIDPDFFKKFIPEFFEISQKMPFEAGILLIMSQDI